MVWTDLPGPNQGHAAEGDNVSSKILVTKVGRRRYAFPSRRGAIVEHYSGSVEPVPSTVAARGARSPPCNADPDYIQTPESSALRVSKGQGSASINFNQNYCPELDVAASIERAILNRSSRLEANFPDLFHPDTPVPAEVYVEAGGDDQAPRLVNYNNYVMRFGPSLPNRYQRLSSPYAEQEQQPLHSPSPGWWHISQEQAEALRREAMQEAKQQQQQRLGGQQAAGDAPIGVGTQADFVDTSNATCQTVSEASTQADMENLDGERIVYVISTGKKKKKSPRPWAQIRESLAQAIAEEGSAGKSRPVVVPTGHGALQEFYPNSSEVVESSHGSNRTSSRLHFTQFPKKINKSRRENTDPTRAKTEVPARPKSAPKALSSREPMRQAKDKAQPASAARPSPQRQSEQTLQTTSPSRSSQSKSQRRSSMRRTKPPKTEAEVQQMVVITADAKAASVSEARRRAARRVRETRAALAEAEARAIWQQELDRLVAERLKAKDPERQKPRKTHRKTRHSYDEDPDSPPPDVPELEATLTPPAAQRELAIVAAEGSSHTDALRHYKALLEDLTSDSSQAPTPRDGTSPQDAPSGSHLCQPHQSGGGVRGSAESLSELERLIERQHRELVAKGVLSGQSPQGGSPGGASSHNQGVAKELDSFLDDSTISALDSPSLSPEVLAAAPVELHRDLTPEITAAASVSPPERRAPDDDDYQSTQEAQEPEAPQYEEDRRHVAAMESETDISHISTSSKPQADPQALPSLSELRGSIEQELQRARRVLDSTAHLSSGQPQALAPSASREGLGLVDRPGTSTKPSSGLPPRPPGYNPPLYEYTYDDSLDYEEGSDNDDGSSGSGSGSSSGILSGGGSGSGSGSGSGVSTTVTSGAGAQQPGYSYNSDDDLLLMAPRPLDSAPWALWRSESLESKRSDAQMMGRPSAPTPMKMSGAAYQIDLELSAMTSEGGTALDTTATPDIDHSHASSGSAEDSMLDELPRFPPTEGPSFTGAGVGSSATSHQTSQTHRSAQRSLEFLSMGLTSIDDIPTPEGSSIITNELLSSDSDEGNTDEASHMAAPLSQISAAGRSIASDSARGGSSTAAEGLDSYEQSMLDRIRSSVTKLDEFLDGQPNVSASHGRSGVESAYGHETQTRLV